MTRIRFWVGLALTLTTLAGTPLGMLAAESAAGGDWYAVKLNGRTMGHLRVAFQVQDNGERLIEVENRNRFSREGAPFEMQAVSRFVEGHNGDPVRFSYDYTLADQHLMHAEGQVAGDALDVTMRSPEAVQTAQAPIVREQFLFPGGPRMDEVFQAHFNDAPGSRFRFQTLAMAAKPVLVDTEVTVDHPEADPAILALAQGEALRRFALRNPVNADSTVYEWRNAQGKLYLAQAPGNGMEMVYAATSKVSPQTLDIINDSQVLTNIIPQPRNTVEALYKIAPLRGRQVNWENFPDSTWQRKEEASAPALTSVTPDFLYLRVKQTQPPDVSLERPIRVDDRRYLAETPYLQIRDELVERTAEDVVGTEKRAYFAARKLRDWVHQNIRFKTLNMGFGSAKETLLSREGDCTEHAVLLTALTRAVGIPSRVAIGLVYLPENSPTLGRFVYHMWTEVYIGQFGDGGWYPLDAAFPEPLPDATHIKLGDSALSSLDDVIAFSEQVARLMGSIKIDVVKAMAAGQSVITVGKQPGVLTVDIPKIDIQSIDIKTLSAKAIKRYRVELPPKALSENSPEGLFTHGVEAMADGRYTQGVSYLRRALAKLRRPVEFYRMGEQLAAIEQYDLAREAFEKARSMDERFGSMIESWYAAFFPENTLSPQAQALFSRAVSLKLYKGEDQQAFDLFKQVLDMEPAYVPAMIHIGQLAERNGYNQEAFESYALAVQTDPDICGGFEHLGDAAMLGENYPVAVKHYDQAIACYKPHDFAQTKSWLDSLNAKRKLAYGAALLAKNSRSVEGWTETAKGLYMQQRYGEARTAVQNAISAGQAPEALLYKFKIAYHDNDWTTMDKLYGALGSVAARHAHAAFVKGLYEMRMRDYPTAVQTLKKAITMDPASPDAYIILAQTYQRQGELLGELDKYQGYAQQTLTSGLPKMVLPWNKHRLHLELAALALKVAKAEDGARHADEALAINPVSAKGYRLRGQAALYANALEDARVNLDAALVLNPNDSVTLTLLGHTAYENGQETVAYDFYQKAHKANPLDADARKSLRKLIEELNLAAKKPDELMVLSDDERDYLIQALQYRQRVNEFYVNSMRQLNDTINSDFIYLTQVSSIRARQEALPLLERLYDQALWQYQSLQKWKPPARMAGIHHGFLQTSYGQLLSVKVTLDNLIKPAVGPEEIQQRTQEVDSINQSIAMSGMKLMQDLQGLEARVGQDALKEVVLEANMDMEGKLVKEFQTLFSEIQNKMLGQTPDPNKGNPNPALQEPGASAPAPNAPLGAPPAPPNGQLPVIPR